VARLRRRRVRPTNPFHVGGFVMGMLLGVVLRVEQARPGRVG
jgi:hypothetical protein